MFADITQRYNVNAIHGSLIDMRGRHPLIKHNHFHQYQFQTDVQFPTCPAGERRFECPMCSVVCSDSFSLQEHVELHLDHGAGGWIIYIRHSAQLPLVMKMKMKMMLTCLWFTCRESRLRPEAGDTAAAGGGAEEEAGGGSAGERGVQEAAGLDSGGVLWFSPSIKENGENIKFL